MNTSKLLISLLFVFVVSVLQAQQEILALKGGTVIDVTDFGNSERDLKNATIIIENGKIKTVGPASSVKIPKGAKVIDISGKYVVPGLIDAFGVINNQAYGQAYLYMGVTTVVSLDHDDRRGNTDWNAQPSPAKIRIEGYWGADMVYDREQQKFENLNTWSDEKVSHGIDSLAQAGVQVLLVHYGVLPKQLPAIVSACKRNNIATIGELGLTSYHEAVDAGIQSFVHTSRYSADVLPDSVRQKYSTSPFGPAGGYHYQYITERKSSLSRESKLLELASLYENHSVGLIPTASMIQYPEMDFAKNPWDEPIASIINEKDIEHEPLDRKTGKRKKLNAARANAAPALFEIDKLFAKHKAHFLTGTGTDAFGTIPGVAMHTELQMLSHIGLTNRQCLAAATHNFSLLWNWTTVGKIEQGREADILVLNTNPLVTIENLKDIDVLISDGKILDRKALAKAPGF